MKTTYETDWLGSQPIFYNEKTGKISKNINNVIDFQNLEFHPEGFNNYLDFGYSVFEQTPIKNVKFLRHSSRLNVDENGKIEVEYLNDIAEEWIGTKSSEDDVWQLLESSVQNWENAVNGEIIVPTSGGYDSRILNFFLKDKSRVRSFTYGTSEYQSESFEVVYAKKLSEILGIKWEHITLGEFHKYFNDWDKLFGISTHAHGMYHMEFYNKILPQVKGNNPFLSGIIGDGWSGKVEIDNIIVKPDLKKLNYNHGLSADSSFSKFKEVNYDLWDGYYNKNYQKLAEPMIRIVESMRFKLILLSYLLSVPTYFGFQPWSPFLKPEIALSILTLPEKRRKNRAWQKEFFKKNGLDLESMQLKVSYQNNLNHQAMRKMPVPHLNISLLREVIEPSYIKWINFHVSQQGPFWDWFWSLNKVPKLGGAMRRIGIREKRLKAYHAYLTLKPIENVLIKRNQACGIY